MEKKTIIIRGFIFISFVLLFNFNAKSQSVHYYMGANAQSDNLGKFQIFSYDERVLYIFRVKDEGTKNVYHLQTYSRDSLKLVSSTKIPFPDRGDVVVQIQNLFLHDDYYQVFYSWFDHVNKQEKVEMVGFSGEGEQIGATKVIDFSEGDTQRKAGFFSVFNRPSRNGFLSFGEKIVKGELMINIDHFNYDGNKLRTTNFNNVGLRQVTYAGIDGTGSIVYITRDGYDSFNPDWRMKILTPDSEEPIRLLLQKPDEQKYYLSDRFFSFEDGDGHMNFITLFSGKRTGKYTDGLYLVRLDRSTHSILKEEFFQFRNGSTKDNYREKDFGSYSNVISNVVLAPGGERQVLFESRIKILHNTEHEYMAGPIMIVAIDSSGKVTGISKIPKQQEAIGDNERLLGFNVLQRGNRSFYIYNELPENLAAEMAGSPAKLKDASLNKTVIAVVTADENGVTGKKALVEKSDSEKWNAVLVNESLYTSDDELYTLCQVDKEIYLTKIYVGD
jgi:hypothetical protein